MTPLYIRTLCMTGLLALSAVVVQAQDVIVTPKTKSETTTTSPAKETPKPKPTPKPAPKPKATTGELSLTSTPSGAVVKIDGKYKGETPLELEAQKPQTYSVTFSAEGYESQTKKVTVTAGGKATCNATLKKKEAQQQVAQQSPSTLNSPLDLGRSTLGEPLTAATQTFTANGVSFKMIRVEGGTFTMGATSEQGSDANDWEKPVHRVTLSSYYIGETEVTQELWEAVMGTTVRQQRDKANKVLLLRGVGYNYPMYFISWDECKTFISKLNSLTGKNFRMPTEAEWEFAARGGNKSQSYKYSGSNTIGNVAWYTDNSGCETHPVKTKSPNELGIYDMSGNVWEWCQDWDGDYGTLSQTNPTGPSSGSYRVDRGGSFGSDARSCRVACRDCYAPDVRIDNLGLRLALDK